MTFWLVALRAFSYKGRSYEAGDRFQAGLGDAYRLITRRQAKKVPAALATAVPSLSAPSETPKKRRGRKPAVVAETPAIDPEPEPELSAEQPEPIPEPDSIEQPAPADDQPLVTLEPE